MELVQLPRRLRRGCVLTTVCATPRPCGQDERLVLTPFEKNLEVWRQLWRVLERSDVVVQVRLQRGPFARPWARHAGLGACFVCSRPSGGDLAPPGGLPISSLPPLPFPRHMLPSHTRLLDSLVVPLVRWWTLVTP